MSFVANACSGQALDTADAERGIPPAISEVLEQLVKEAAHALDRDRDTARACLRRVATLLQTQAAGERGDQVSPGMLAPWQVRRMTAYIERRLDGEILLSALAAECRLSPSHFSRAFKNSFRLPPHSYVLARRIARAQHHMLTGDEPLTRIALMCGFADQAHFCRVFRRLVGKSPTQWRRSHSGGPLDIEPAEVRAQPPVRAAGSSL